MLNFAAWSSVFSELDHISAEGTDKRSRQSKFKLTCKENLNITHYRFSDGRTAFYYEDEPCTSLADFKPFDLESWWGRRLYAYITNSTNSNC